MIENNNLTISNFLFSNKSVDECTWMYMNVHFYLKRESSSSSFFNDIIFWYCKQDTDREVNTQHWGSIYKMWFDGGNYDQGLQALLLTSVYHEGLSFMVIGQNSTCSSCLALAAGGSRGCYKSCRKSPFGYFSNPKFSNSLSMHHSVT